MTLLQTRLESTRPARGFSMIDVLVAIIVLATALLALAALQGALTRNSADSRARSQIASYAEGLLDQLRSSGYDGITDGTTTVSPATGSTAQKTVASSIQTAAAVSNLSTKIKTEHYYGTSTGFTMTAPSSTDNTTPEYKQVNVTTSWTDASGQARTLELSTIISPVSIDTSNNSLDNQTLTPTTSNTPVVRQYDPAKTAGVIPIAIGDSTETAATNPQPEILGSKTQLLAGVSYNVLTYTSPETVDGNDDQTQITKLVDTRVIRCSCKYGAGLTDTTNVFTQPYRPTYWGKEFKYVAPDPTSAKFSHYGADPNATQDEFCDICCRDRNDTSGDSVKFNPWNSDYGHYYYSGNTLTAVPGCDSTGCTGTDTTAYSNACRLIRVDGEYRVATDLQNYFFGLLATDDASSTGIPKSSSSSSTASSPIPTETAEDHYKDFVKQYLTLNHGWTKSTTFTNANYPYDDPSDPTSVKSDNVTLSDAAKLWSDNSLNDPTSIGITYSSSVTDYRYLHSRGLYIDYLEPETLEALNDAVTNCSGSSTTELENCLLPDVPFTTINVTQLSNWAVDTSGKTVISVSDTAIPGGDPDNPLRGVVNALSTAKKDDAGSAVANTGLSNSGLTGVVSQVAITPADASSNLTVKQLFTLGSGGNTSGNTLYFNISLANLSQLATNANVSADPTVVWAGTATQLGTAATGNAAAYQTGSSGSYSVLYVGSVVATTTCNNSGKNCTTTYSTQPNSVAPTIAAPVGLNVTVQYYNTQTLGSATTGNGKSGCTSIINTVCSVNQVSSLKIGSNTFTGWTTAPLNSSDTIGLNAGTVITIPSTPGFSSTDSTSPDLLTITFANDSANSYTVSGTCGNCNSSGKNCTYTPGVCTN